MKIKVLIVDRIFARSKDIFAGAEDIEFIVVGKGEEEIASAIVANGANAVVLATEKYTNQLYEALPEGGLIARYGVGHDGVDKALASAKGQAVTVTFGVLNDSVAEHTMFLMGAALRNVVACDRAIRSGKWLTAQGGELNGKTLALIGCGRIAKRVAKIASFGFGMRVVGVNIIELDKEQLRRDYGIQEVYDNYPQAVENADVVSIHLSATEATVDYVNKEFLAAMPKRAVLINTSRGSIVDEAALFDALKDGEIAAAAIDVYKREPYTPVDENKDLRSLDNIVMTSHISSSTREASQRMAQSVLKNIRLWAKGDLEGMDLVNKDILAK